LFAFKNYIYSTSENSNADSTVIILERCFVFTISFASPEFFFYVVGLLRKVTMWHMTAANTKSGAHICLILNRFMTNMKRENFYSTFLDLFTCKESYNKTSHSPSRLLFFQTDFSTKSKLCLIIHTEIKWLSWLRGIFDF